MSPARHAAVADEWPADPDLACKALRNCFPGYVISYDSQRGSFQAYLDHGDGRSGIEAPDPEIVARGIEHWHGRRRR